MTMNFFEAQLNVFTGKQTAFKSSKPLFAGRAAFIRLSGSRRARIEFATCGTQEHYEALQVTIINALDGKIDALKLRFADYFATRKGSCAGTYVPHIWARFSGGYEWYGPAPSSSEIKAITDAAYNYIMLFE